ncbi:energy transducer TonB [Photobacterium aphoticum]|uniref:Protein TonB n=1 Tax=Photobacterium aphoticum TaxID=754436 RepID=A0A090R0G9_9GAMM|nr:energy transducer TonB [Photobacterium aphoticum]KLU99307.1 sugar ABC transporter substrate-binding protein [Photobacterium aphoticum]PSU55787.1 energy transducer TonB [Photobacterium aphoticum]GAL07599.1 ferric siderophore transport system periplasmic binding protein TonB [Photobacterium aphoticum]GHA59926.1 protein TonB [Photobacterium aphoticum]
MRYLASLALALVVSLGLFWGMDKLVNKERHELTSNEDLRMVDFIRVKPEEKIQEKKRELPKPPPPKRPPPPPEMKVTSTVKPVMEQMPMDMPKLDLPVNVTGGSVLGHYSQGGGAQVTGSGGPMPLATFQPQMPRKAARSGLEKGVVLVEFTVNARGGVENVKVLKESPRKLGLGKAARKAVSKWTFKPKQVDGKPVSARLSQEIEFSVN